MNFQERCDLKVTKKQGFTLSLENTFFNTLSLEKPQGWVGGQIAPPPPPPASLLRVIKQKDFWKYFLCLILSMVFEKSISHITFY